VGANVRRIEAVTGRAAVAYYRERDDVVRKAAAMLGTTDEEILHGLDKLQARTCDLETEVKGFLKESAKDLVQQLVDLGTECEGVTILADVVEARDMDRLLSLVDQIRDRIQPSVVALGAEIQGKAVLVVSASQGVTKVNAGEIVKSSARLFSGGGGGTAQLGRGGGGDPAKLPEAVAASREAVIAALSD